jgi:hypothetical protein
MAFLATHAQRAYLRRLLDEAFAHRVESAGFDRHHLDRITSAQAAAEIRRLLKIKDANWGDRA